jgi:hypothetical protein
MYYGRNVEPIAFSLINEAVTEPQECLLLNAPPKEIRDMIYAYVFTDNMSHPPNRNNEREHSGKGKELEQSDIAFPFLQTCKMVYLEAYQLPFTLNPLIVYDFQVPTRPRLYKLAPWQFALIQGLDISLQQIALERGELANYMENWKARDRHLGAYVAPRFYSGHNKINGPGRDRLIQSFNFGLSRAEEVGSTSPKDRDGVAFTDKRDFYGFYGTSGKEARPIVRDSRHWHIRGQV